MLRQIKKDGDLLLHSLTPNKLQTVIMGGVSHLSQSLDFLPYHQSRKIMFTSIAIVFKCKH